MGKQIHTYLTGILIFISVIAKSQVPALFSSSNYYCEGLPGVAFRVENLLSDSRYSPEAFGEFANVQTWQNNLAKRIAEHVYRLSRDTYEGRGLGTEGIIKVRSYIAENFRQAGLSSDFDNYFQNFEIRQGNLNLRGVNIIGHLEGSDPQLSNEIIVIGTHYDHLGYTTDNECETRIPNSKKNNLTGIAALIELAYYFANSLEKLGRSIVFIAFDANLSGNLGAQNFIYSDECSGNTYLSDQIKLMLNISMIDDGYESLQGEHLNMSGIKLIKGGTDIAPIIANKYDIGLKNFNSRFKANSDTRPFGSEGIPAIHISTDFSKKHFRRWESEEVCYYLNYESIARKIEFLQEFITELSYQPELNLTHNFFRPNNLLVKRFSVGITTHCGSSFHKFPDEFYTRAQGIFSFATGLFARIHLNKVFAINTEVLFDYDGSKSPEGTFTRHSITIPVYLTIGIPYNQNVDFSGFYIIGIYSRNTFSGKNGNEKLDFNKIYQKNEIGINFGVGYDIGRVRLAYTVRNGIKPVSRVSESEFYSSGHYFTLGYRF